MVSILASLSFLQTLLPLINWVLLALERTHTDNKSRQLTNSWNGWTCVACKPHCKPPLDLERGFRDGRVNIFVAIFNCIETPDLFKYFIGPNNGISWQQLTHFIIIIFYYCFYLFLQKELPVSNKNGSTSWHFKLSACSNKVGTNFIRFNFFNRVRKLLSYCW